MFQEEIVNIDYFLKIMNGKNNTINKKKDNKWEGNI